MILVLLVYQDHLVLSVFQDQQGRLVYLEYKVLLERQDHLDPSDSRVPPEDRVLLEPRDLTVQ